jgi:hypothetical protein
MSKAHSLFGLLTLVGLAWAASGCSNSCDDADELCSGCPAQSSCQASVDSCRTLAANPVYDESDCCDNLIEQYNDQC